MSTRNHGIVRSGATRRNFMKAGAAAGVAVTASSPAIAQSTEPVVLTMQMLWAEGSILAQMAQQYADRVDSMSGGRLTINLLPIGTADPFGVQEACSSGQVDAVHLTSVYWYDTHSAASLFGTGPSFGIDAAQLLAWVHVGGGKELYRELVQEVLGLNLVGFFTMPMPAQPLGWFSQPITNVQQLAGQRYRTVGLAAALMESIGMQVQRSPGGEIIPAVNAGALDAFEYNNPTSDLEFGAHEARPVYMMSSFHQAGEFFEIIFNKDRFEALPADLQAILEHSAEAASLANYSLAMNSYSRSLQQLIHEHGIEVYRTPQSVLEAQLEGWDSVIDDLSTDDFYRRVIDSQHDWAERVGYYSLMNETDHRLAFNHHFPGRLGR